MARSARLNPRKHPKLRVMCPCHASPGSFHALPLQRPAAPLAARKISARGCKTHNRTFLKVKDLAVPWSAERP